LNNKITPKEIDKLRDDAVSLEKTNLNESLRLMKFALLNRPEGGFIKSKVKKYEEALELRGTILDSIPSGSLTMKVRHSGIGDMLGQISTFFWVCKLLNKRPFIYVDDTHGHNEENVADIFQFLGLRETSVFLEGFSWDSPKALSKYVDEKMPLGTQHLYFDNESYGNSEINKILHKINPRNIANIDLTTYLFKGQLYKEIVKTGRRKDKIVVHLRRGDVSQVPLRLLSDILSVDTDLNDILHITGVFKPEELKANIAASNYVRFKTIDKYKTVIESLQTESSDVDFYTVLLSDGMSRLAKAILNKKLLKFKAKTMSQWRLERSLEKEIFSLAELCNECSIGENRGALFDTIIEGLTGNVIISSSPGFFHHLNELLDLKIKIIRV
jgi:hypothetical protein